MTYPSLLYAPRTNRPSSVMICGTPGSGILTVGGGGAWSAALAARAAASITPATMSTRVGWFVMCPPRAYRAWCRHCLTYGASGFLDSELPPPYDRSFSGGCAVRDCANHLGVPATAACRRCDTPICDACKETLDGQPYCTSCVKTLTRRLAGAPATDPAPPALIEPPRAALSPKAIAGAIAGGVAGALLWYGIVAVTDTKIGIVAI